MSLFANIVFMLIYLNALASWIIASAMENMKSPFQGVIKDVRGRLSCYKQDWIAGLSSGLRYDLFCMCRVINLRLVEEHFDTLHTS